MQNPTDIINEAEQLIRKINGVLSCKIITDSQGNISEIHVVSSQARAAKQLSRDIQSALAASLGICVEHKIISIAQIDYTPSKPTPRLKVSGISVETINGLTNLRITLSIDDNTYIGDMRASTQRVRFKATAMACINAIHAYLGRDNVFQLIEAQKLSIAGENIWIVVLSANIDGNEKTFCGSAIVHMDDYYAICCAVLDAVNRVLGILKKEE